MVSERIRQVVGKRVEEAEAAVDLFKAFKGRGRIRRVVII